MIEPDVSRQPPDSRPAPPTMAEAVRVWALIGLNSFGGPAGQIGIMHRALVDERSWVSERRFLHALSYCMLLPGPEAKQLAVYIGWLLHGFRGGLIAGLLFVLPGALVIGVLSVLYVAYADSTFLDALFYGIKPAVIAVVAGAVIRMGSRVLGRPLLLGAALAAFVGIFFLEVPFPIIVAGAASLGFVLGPRLVEQPAPEADTDGEGGGAAALDDTESGVRPPLRRTIRVLAIGLAAWFGPVVVLAAWLGAGSVLVQLAGFFSSAAIVTFGGAYAVLGYVAQHAVEARQWMQPGEMLDGLAMAEATPGPLIMVVQFVGFMAAHREPFGVSPVMAGMAGAAITLWVTFVPSFLWIFLGAPYAEYLRGRRRLGAALTAVTAAVVGVIANLAAWFAIHALFADVAVERAGPVRLLVPSLGSIDLGGVVIMLGALVALFGLRWPVLVTLALGAAVGIAYRLATG